MHQVLAYCSNFILDQTLSVLLHKAGINIVLCFQTRSTGVQLCALPASHLTFTVLGSAPKLIQD